MIYTVSFDEVGVTTVEDLFEILAPADACLIIHQITVSQSSDSGDAESEQLHLTIRRVTGSPTSGSGGTNPTPVPIEGGAAASGVTADANNGTQLTGGTNTVYWAEAFNVLAGFNWLPTPETRLIISPSTRLLVELETTPADSLTLSGTVTFDEVGG